MSNYEYEVQGYYDTGWESIFTANTADEARQVLADYQANAAGTSFRISKVRGEL
jgi:hypothetical protein